MPLIVGTRIGAYQIVSALGAGGMGEVYRATDTNLKRQVAIKVLPPAVTGDIERVARMRREAEVLATLNHPNIAQIFGLETSSDELALVMELIEGPTLADRIAVGPLPPDEALVIARQIAEALEAAHDQNIVHRDLKPANVKVRPDGTVKVLDFGLAKSIETAATTSPLSPTITTPAMTHAGVILGTAAYMSPEQARGKPVDRRTDVWAFGCVLFEMLAGRRPFAEEDTVSDTLAAILKGEPAWEALPATTPPRIRALLEKCLRKDVRRRLPHIAAARIDIDEAGSDTPPAASAPGSDHRWHIWLGVAVLASLTAGVLIGTMLLRPAAARPIARFEILPPAGAMPFPGLGRSIEIGDPISPDGSTIALLARVKGTGTIWLRRLDSPELRPVPRTDGAGRPFWSADSRWLAFFAQGQLKKIAVAGGPPVVICDEPGRDVAWNSEDVILIGGNNKPLRRVAASGGEPIAVTELAPGETTHDYPQFLPDNRHFIYLARQGPNPEDWNLFVGALDSQERHLLDGIHTAVRYVSTGHLLFAEGDKLMAQPFDVNRLALSGEPTIVAHGVETGPRPLFALSADGSLVHRNRYTIPESQLAWIDRTGAQATPFTQTGLHNRVALSPDGRRVAFDRQLDIFLFDVERNALTSFVSHPGADVSPVFSADGRRVAFASSRDSALTANNLTAGELYERATDSADGAGVRITTDGGVVASEIGGKAPTDWSRDGHILYSSGSDIWALSSARPGAAQPVRLTNTPFIEGNAKFSPDGRWIAYQSSDSATGQDVYVQSFPDGRRRYAISVGGGSVPRWARTGSELYYIGPDATLMAVSIRRTGEELQIGRAVRLFQSRALERDREYDVAPDGRFLINLPVEERTGDSLTVVLNWATQLNK